MKVVISSIGSRGDIQPLIALGLALQSLGHGVTLCVPPNFQQWIESRGLSCVPLGQDLQKWTENSDPLAKENRSRSQRRKQLMAGMQDTIREHFSVTKQVAQGCDLIIVANGIQSAGGSIAQFYNIPYVFVTYCPVTLRSSAHPPPMVRWQNLPGMANRLLWAFSESMWNKAYRETVNSERQALGLAPVPDVVGLITTRDPWVAADPSLAPAMPSGHQIITQTGAWVLADSAPLPRELESFLSAGDPPVYLGFGSMWASAQASTVLLNAARATGRRIILSKGWGNLGADEQGTDCIVIGDVPHGQLFPRVAAVVHHGGAGTTTAAALAGVPQVVIPHVYDQYYWAHRVQKLGIGVAGPSVSQLEAPALADSLLSCLRPQCGQRAKAFASSMERNGAQKAAERLTAAHEFSER